MSLSANKTTCLIFKLTCNSKNSIKLKIASTPSKEMDRLPYSVNRFLLVTWQHWDANALRIDSQLKISPQIIPFSFSNLNFSTWNCIANRKVLYMAGYIHPWVHWLHYWSGDPRIETVDYKKAMDEVWVDFTRATSSQDLGTLKLGR